MKKSQNVFVILIISLFFTHGQVLAQCAMCKAQVESNISDGSQNVGAGLNKGILFLMTVPYIILMVLAWYFFGNKIKTIFKSYKSIYPKV